MGKVFVERSVINGAESLTLTTKEAWEEGTEDYKQHNKLLAEVTVTEDIEKLMELSEPKGKLDQLASETNDTVRIKGLVEYFTLKLKVFKDLGYKSYAETIRSHIEYLQSDL